jgi:hypothetical protein
VELAPGPGEEKAPFREALRRVPCVREPAHGRGA